LKRWEKMKTAWFVIFKKVLVFWCEKRERELKTRTAEFFIIYGIIITMTLESNYNPLCLISPKYLFMHRIEQIYNRKHFVPKRKFLNYMSRAFIYCFCFYFCLLQKAALYVYALCWFFACVWFTTLRKLSRNKRQ
jgi:hypothetical protein